MRSQDTRAYDTVKFQQDPATWYRQTVKEYRELVYASMHKLEYGTSKQEVFDGNGRYSQWHVLPTHTKQVVDGPGASRSLKISDPKTVGDGPQSQVAISEATPSEFSTTSEDVEVLFQSHDNVEPGPVVWSAQNVTNKVKVVNFSHRRIELPTKTTKARRRQGKVDWREYLPKSSFYGVGPYSTLATGWQTSFGENASQKYDIIRSGSLNEERYHAIAIAKDESDRGSF